jgi:large subunit ribosomal protein L47
MLNSIFSKLIPFVTLKCNQITHTSKLFSTSLVRKDLMEFFDNKKNWNEKTVKHGREWRPDELRLKSNTDLHKLWFILLKERNMLLTMEEEYKRENLVFPSPERIAKVDSSMENLLSVVKERDIAYNLLETGETKEIIPYKRYNSFGFLQHYKPKEYYVPWYLNTKWKLLYHHKQLPKWSKYYRVRLRAKEAKERRKKLKFIEEKADEILNEFDELKLDREHVIENLKQKYKYTEELPYESQIKKPRPDQIPIKKSIDNDEF